MHQVLHEGLVLQPLALCNPACFFGIDRIELNGQGIRDALRKCVSACAAFPNRLCKAFTVCLAIGEPPFGLFRFRVEVRQLRLVIHSIVSAFQEMPV
jgi:hypothetical protein